MTRLPGSPNSTVACSLTGDGGRCASGLHALLEEVVERDAGFSTGACGIDQSGR